MSAPAIADFLSRESGRYMTPIMERRVFPRSIILSLIPRGEWASAMGTSVNLLQYERSAPTAVQTWSAVAVTDGQEGGSCLPQTTQINVGSTNRSYSLSQAAFRGPPICNIDAMPSFDLYNQLAATAGILGDYTKLIWEQRYREEYFRLCNTKICYDACAPSFTRTDTMATTYPASVCPAKALDIGILRALSIEFMRDGAGAEALLRGSGGEGLLTVLTDSEASGDIRFKNLEIRQDIRWSNQNSLLLRNFGVGMDDFGGFTFIVDSFPRRFICNAGTYTQQLPFSTTTASRGIKATVNSSWKTAPVSETFIFDRTVMTVLIPRPPTAPHPEFNFNPVNYLGDLKLMNILNDDTNPDGNIVYHRMRVMAGSMPNNIERGAAIAHLRCDPAGCSTGCASS
jgi:hypothetical protein